MGGGILAGGEGCSHACTIDAGVEVSRTSHFELVETFDRAETRDNFFSDFARGLAQFLRQLEG
jgi:hypothetical protein